MREHGVHAGYRSYVVTWLILLLLTVAMLFFDQVAFSRWFLIAFLVLAMLFKASIIASNFMHLRFERPSLTLMVIVGLLVTGAVLFSYLVPDALRILKLSAR